MTSLVAHAQWTLWLLAAAWFVQEVPRRRETQLVPVTSAAAPPLPLTTGTGTSCVPVCKSRYCLGAIHKVRPHSEEGGGTTLNDMGGRGRGVKDPTDVNLHERRKVVFWIGRATL